MHGRAAPRLTPIPREIWVLRGAGHRRGGGIEPVSFTRSTRGPSAVKWMTLTEAVPTANRWNKSRCRPLKKAMEALMMSPWETTATAPLGWAVGRM